MMSAEPKIIELVSGRGPLAAAAIHNGHYVRPEVEELLSLTAAERLREEDPFTGLLAQVAPTRLIGLRSRFEVDLNRPLEKAVYFEPEDAWGLNVWRQAPSPAVVGRSLAGYARFYATAETVLRRLVDENGCVVVFDLHSYNHRRNGPGGPAADPAGYPEVNIGTRTMNRGRWAPVVERFIDDLRQYDYFGRRLDVRENVSFFGGNFCRWIHQTFPTSVCALAIEFKKFFMDEWTGEADRRQLDELRSALASTIPGVLQALDETKSAGAAAAGATPSLEGAAP